MKFVLSRTSSDNLATVEVNTLEALIRFMKKSKHSIIISHNFFQNKSIDILTEGNVCSKDTAQEIVKCPYKIEIYDGYRE